MYGCVGMDVKASWVQVYVAGMCEDVGMKGVGMWVLRVEYFWTTDEIIWGGVGGGKVRVGQLRRGGGEARTGGEWTRK